MRAVFFVLALCVLPCFCYKDLEKFKYEISQKVRPYFNSSLDTPEGTSNFYLNVLCGQDVREKEISKGCSDQLEIVCDHSEILSQTSGIKPFAGENDALFFLGTTLCLAREWTCVINKIHSIHLNFIKNSMDTMDTVDYACSFSRQTEMSDAWSKFPYTGMQVSTRQDWGTFDQCVAIDYRPENGPRILGKHCANGLALPVSTEDIYMLSYCVPDSCSALDIANLITILPFPGSIVRELVNDVFCVTKKSNQTLDTSSIVIACLFGLFVALILLSTAYEVILHRRGIKNKSPGLVAFSLYTNIKKLVQTTHKHGAHSDQILVVHGIKVISMMWIVAGHNAGGFSVVPSVNRQLVETWEYHRYSQYIMTAYLAVDTFFYISGFLMAYGYFKVTARKPVVVQVASIPQMIIHRYIRITPAVLMVFLYSVYLAKHMGHGPIFSVVHDSLAKPCIQNWWAFFLYIQNYYNPTNLCLTHLWYLSTDFQLFLVAPIFIIPIASQYRKRFKGVMWTLLFVNIVVMLIPLMVKLLAPEFDPNNEEYDMHSKLINYLLGITFGFYLRCARDRPYAFKGALNTIMWSLTIAAMLGTTFVLQEINMNHGHTAQSLCLTFLKPVWCMSLSFIIYSCTHGQGGVVTWILSGGIMQVLSKLTFCMYIMHAPIIYMWVSTRRTREFWSDFNLFYAWCGHFMLTLVVSIIWTLAFESPLITVERMIFGAGKRRKSENQQERKEKAKSNEPIEVTHKTAYENGHV